MVTIDPFRLPGLAAAVTDDGKAAAILTALADPTRRAVLDRLREGPQPVVAIARTLPVTRPAVSQHLRVLLDAGLVTCTPRGTRNLYGLAPGGAQPLTDWLGALGGARAVPEPQAGVTVRLTREEAWRLFLDDIAIWWPVAELSFSALRAGALPQAVIRDGDRLRETLFDGSTADWARLREARMPERLEMDWQLAVGARLVVTFTAEAGGCRVALDWGGAEAGEMTELLLDRFGAAARASLSNF